MESGNVLFALALTILARLSTGIGSAIAFFTRTTNRKFLSLSLGFLAGVMIYVSFIEIFPKAKTAMLEHFSSDGAGLADADANKMAYWYTVFAFFAGIFIIALINRVIPSGENPHELHAVEEMTETRQDNKKLMRMGLFTNLAIRIHNFPEGIAVSVPIYYTTKSRRKAFWYSFTSDLSKPIGAIIGYLILMPFLNDLIFGVVFAGGAGIMVFISLDELLPAAEEFGEHHLSIYGLIAGMAVMALSLLLFA
jgi:zinc transporter, ZIP family